MVASDQGAGGVADPAGELWAAYWRRQHPGVRPSALMVELAPAAKVTRAEAGLVLPVTITNRSSEEVVATLTHEWHGGEWPPCDVYASVTPAGATKLAPFAPAFVVGEKLEAAEPTTLAPGQSVTADLRMDWPGTGSQPATPFMEASVPGRYRVRLLLVFEAKERRQFVASGEKPVESPAEQPPGRATGQALRKAGRAAARPGEAKDGWSLPVNGLRARLAVVRKGSLNGTPILVSYIELHNGSDQTIEIPWDEAELRFSVTDAAGKDRAAAGGRYDEIRGPVGVLRLPPDSTLRLNVTHRGAGVPKDRAGHLDLGPLSHWSFRPGLENATVSLHGTLRVQSREGHQLSGTIRIPRVAIEFPVD